MNIDNIFVDNDNHVFDLEKKDGTIIDDYCDHYDKSWSDNYYENVKVKIKEFREKIKLSVAYT